MSYENHLTVEEVLNEMGKYSETEKIILSNGMFLDGSFDSYRGYYDHLAIDFSENDKGMNTVGGFKGILKKALYVGVMCGYKGGEYSISDDTPVWFAHYGTTSGSEMIVGIERMEDGIRIVTKEDRW